MKPNQTSRAFFQFNAHFYILIVASLSLLTRDREQRYDSFTPCGRFQLEKHIIPSPPPPPTPLQPSSTTYVQMQACIWGYLKYNLLYYYQEISLTKSLKTLSCKEETILTFTGNQSILVASSLGPVLINVRVLLDCLQGNLINLFAICYRETTHKVCAFNLISQFNISVVPKHSEMFC